MKKFYSLFLALFFLLLAGCNKENNSVKVTAEERQDIVLTKAQARYVQEGNVFACKILSDVLKQQKGSFMISPLSIRYALSMLANGASESTLEELLNLLDCDASEIGDVNEFCKYLTDALLAADNTVEMSLANALVGNSAFTGKMGLKKSFTETLETCYNALIKSYNFHTENSAAVNAINSWADKNTKGMIPDLVSGLNKDAYLLLMNAIYFKGNWNSTVDFKESDTRKENFEREDGSKNKIDIMRMEGNLSYASGDVCDILELPYGNGAFRMHVMLPKKGNGLADIAVWMQGGGSYVCFPMQVKLKLPKFETGGRIELSQILGKYIPSSFSEYANFSGMTDAPVMVSEVYQKSKIKLNETGTESAAVTVVELVASSNGSEHSEPSVIEFYATRPFLYTISEVSTGAMLFAGVFKGE